MLAAMLSPEDDLRASYIQELARAILAGFDRHYRFFRTVSMEAKGRFERGDWAAVRAADRERIDLYDLRVREAAELIARRFSVEERIWPALKQAYLWLLYDHQQPECAETFFNSVACRLLHRRYFNNQHLFWRPGVATDHISSLQPTWRTYAPDGTSLKTLLRQLLLDLQIIAGWEDLERDLASLERAFLEAAPGLREPGLGRQLQVLSSAFFRNRAAFAMGRVLDGKEQVPFAIALRRNDAGELYADALLTRRDDLDSLFSTSRAYFMADMEVPASFVSFLSALLPDKPKAELYTSLGLQKQGKTLFYRDLDEHLKHSADRMIVAPGVRGMVMLVFTLPSFPYVFKIIRDSFEPPKDTSFEKVQAQYQFVKHAERAGRLVDTLEFSDVAFPLGRFTPELLRELAEKVPTQLEQSGSSLVIRHLYVERRLVPLDVYLRTASEEEARAALADYGHALRELADVNLFPGDLLLKNFGVTRFGRVQFYDYDEISPLDELRFRDLPEARSDEEELSAEPWYYVDPRDVFPQELERFLFKPHEARLFREEHAELLTARFWQEKQRRVRQGQAPEVFAYPPARRFPHPHR
jgi:isocitrate dehydrogenase kinase/phosphatase